VGNFQHIPYNSQTAFKVKMSKAKFIKLRQDRTQNGYLRTKKS